MNQNLRQYGIITANYWAFTLTDGALRMLVLLFFHQQGYSPLEIAGLFLFYEIFGVVTNLYGGYLGARIGLNRTMNIGLALQIVALVMLLVPSDMLSVLWVMIAQALSGIAKDLNKMSAKSAIKSLVAQGQQGRLFKWVALLTGSKNALKGLGFFLGGALLSFLTFSGAIAVLAIALSVVWLLSLRLLKQELGKAKAKPKMKQLFAKSPAINALSAARMFLFASRDLWFVIALPVYLSAELGWSSSGVGAFLASWIIGYGAVQALAPAILGAAFNPAIALRWVFVLATVSLLIALGLRANLPPLLVLFVGLAVFALVFALNSALHSYLIVSYASEEGASIDVGFYYMANAMGRLLGTVLSGWLYQSAGLVSCLFVSVFFLLCAAGFTYRLKQLESKGHL